METWIIYGLAAAVIYALSAFLAKIVASRGQFYLEPHTVGLLAGIGVFSAFLAYYLIQSKAGFALPSNNVSLLLGLGTGILWAFATILVYLALSGGANISQLAPLYNLNTLFVAILAIILLHELPDPQHAVRVVAGAALIIAGSYLVS